MDTFDWRRAGRILALVVSAVFFCGIGVWLNNNPHLWQAKGTNIPLKSPFDLAVALGTAYVALWSVWLLNKRTSNSEQTLGHARLSEQANRFQKGSEFLASEKLAVRVAGVALLQEIAVMNPVQYYHAVVNLLIIFAEERTQDAWDSYERLKSKASPSTEFADKQATFALTPEDVLAAVRAIGGIRSIKGWRRYEERWIGSGRLWLKRAILCGRTFRDCNFSHMEIPEALFHGVQFVDCQFEDTVMTSANITNAKLLYCNLADADIHTADPVGTKADRQLILSDCDLRSATIKARDIIIMAMHVRKNARTVVDGKEGSRIAAAIGIVTRIQRRLKRLFRPLTRAFSTGAAKPEPEIEAEVEQG